LIRTALLYGRRGEAERGISYAARALELDKFNPAANYAYGLLARSLGQAVDAKETFGWAARSMEFRSGAYCQIAELYIAENNWLLALEYTEKSVRFNAQNSNALLARAIALRKLGRASEALAVLRDLLQFDPFNHHARFEMHLNAPAEMSPQSFTAGIRTEIAHESYLEVAAAYARLQLRGEALQVLALAPDLPMVNYWRGYLSARDDLAAGLRFLDRAEKAPTDFVFPFREEEIPVLRWAIQERPASWKPRYYLALVLWGKGRKEEALEMMNGCQGVDASSFFVSRALLGKELHGKQILQDLEKAVSMDPGAWRGWHQLISYCSSTGEQSRALGQAEKAIRLHPNQIVLQMDYASALYDARRLRECLKTLSRMQVLPYEGSWEAHDLFVRAHLRLTLLALKDRRFEECLRSLEASKEFPEHLGTGMPWEPDYRAQDYLSYRALREKGKTGEAKRMLEKITSYTNRHKVAWGTEHLIGLVALEKQGEREEADSLARAWQKASPQDPLLVCWLARKNHDDDLVARLSADARRDPRLSLQLEIAEW
jgi:tetratricopeptide (TPR) repeat protein